jgi:orotate phosphoribosyltransferase-like protein
MIAELVDRAVYLYQRGLTIREIAESLRVRRRTVERVLRIWCIDYQRRLGSTAPSSAGAERPGR